MKLRPETLKPAHQGWLQPTGAEVKEVIKLIGINNSEVARLVNLGDSRNVRRWTEYQKANSKTGGTKIPYASWALLCYEAGLGIIWKDTSK